MCSPAVSDVAVGIGGSAERAVAEETVPEDTTLVVSVGRSTKNKNCIMPTN